MQDIRGCRLYLAHNAVSFTTTELGDDVEEFAVDFFAFFFLAPWWALGRACRCSTSSHEHIKASLVDNCEHSLVCDVDDGGSTPGAMV